MAHFLLRNMDRALRERLEEEADSSGDSLAEIIRYALCEHYGVDCSEIKGTPRESTREGSPTVLLKLQDELFEQIRLDSEIKGESMRTLILDALEARYVTRGGNPR